MKEIVNVKIKFREPFRPFAPSVTVDASERYFDLPDRREALPGALHALRRAVKPGQEHVLPAITHVDGTARLQTVHKEQSPLYYKLISLRGRATGAGDHEHVVQPEGRADRDHPGQRLQHVHAQRHGRPRPGELHRGEGRRRR
jgi:hypothetical protein